MQTPRFAWILCLGVFLALFGMAALFYLERMTHLDMAFQTFLILKSGQVEIQSGRFGAVVTQFWPWAAQAVGLPLKGVLMSYSLGHVLWPALLCAGCFYIKQWPWALAMALSCTLLSTHSFYWLSEMPQGLPFLVAIFAWMHTKGSLADFRWWQLGLWLLALWMAFYFHPLVLYALTFLSLFFLLLPNTTRGWKGMHLVSLGVFAALVLLKYKVLKLDWYDAAALKRQEAFGKLWPHWLDLESNRLFMQWSLSDYWLLWAVIAANVIFYIWNKKWLKALLVGLWPIGFVLMVNVPFYEAVGKQFYMENLYLPLAVFAAIPFVFDVLMPLMQIERSSKMAFGVLGIILIINVLRIFQAHQPWTKRMHWEQDFLLKTAQQSLPKIVLGEDQVPMDLLQMSWGSPYEFLMLSALESPKQARSVLISASPAQYDSLLGEKRLFLGSFKNYPNAELPARYFQLDDTKPYIRWKD